MGLKMWWSDLITSYTPVLGPRSQGELMQNSPRYAAMYGVSQLSNLSNKKIDKSSKEDSKSGSVPESGRKTGTRVSGLYASTEAEDNCDVVGNKLTGVGTATKCYSYEDENGIEAFQVVRFEPKTFRQRKWDSDGNKWVWKNSRRDLIYRLPMILHGVKQGETIYVVEGEQDVLTLINQGLYATTAPGGASGSGQKPKWLDEHSRWLDGANRVVIIADNDMVGRAHAIAAYKSIREVVNNVDLTTCSRGKDITECIDRGGSLADLVAFDPIREERVGQKVNSFLRAHPEFVPQRDLVWQTLSYVRDERSWDDELENLVYATHKDL